MKNKIYPCLWFDGTANEAAEFYCSVFENSHIISDTPLVVTFELGGQKFMGLNGGPKFRPNPSVSFFVFFSGPAEVEEAYKKLMEGGQVLMPLDSYDWSPKYAWIQDRFGVSWQLMVRDDKYDDKSFIPALMFTGDNAGKAEEAMQFYKEVFPSSSISAISRYTGEEGEVKGRVSHGRFQLDGKPFIAMDSSLSHSFSFQEGVSIVVECKDQQEIDHYWNALTRDGKEDMCGWLKDRYGLSWQIIPEMLEKWMSGDPEKAKKVMDAFLKMRKFDIAKLTKIYEGK